MNAIKSKSISVSALAAELRSGRPHRLIDVRTPQEYGTFHVPGAQSIPLSDFDAPAFVSQQESHAPVYVLCQTGGRAAKAVEQLERAGCEDCVVVEGGTQAWVDAGLTVHHGQSKVLPLMRQVQIVVGSLAVVGSVLALTVHPWFVVVPLLLGCGLVFAGVSGTCGMALLLARMPWNQGQIGCVQCCGAERR